MTIEKTGPDRSTPKALSLEVASERKTRIMDSTIHLIAERGEAYVRFRDVSADTGLSIGTLQHYFETRDSMLNEAFLRHNRQVLESICAAHDRGNSPCERLRNLLGSIADEKGIELRAPVWIQMVAMARRNLDIELAIKETYELWRRLVHETVADGAASGIFHPVLPEWSITSALLAAVDGYEIVHMLDIKHKQESDVRSQLAALASGLLGVPAGLLLADPES